MLKINCYNEFKIEYLNINSSIYATHERVIGGARHKSKEIISLVRGKYSVNI